MHTSNVSVDGGESLPFEEDCYAYRHRVADYARDRRAAATDASRHPRPRPHAHIHRLRLHAEATFGA